MTYGGMAQKKTTTGKTKRKPRGQKPEGRALFGWLFKWAARIGLGYSIVEPASGARTISGVGVLEKK